MITTLQIFMIGLGMAAAGPCLAACLPLILAYTVGKQARMSRKIYTILLYLTGRLLAYVLLGALAGLSAVSLRGFTASVFSVYARPLTGLISIGLGVMFLIPNRFSCHTGHERVVSGGIFVAGFITGVSPCGPLLALLSEIVLISHSPWQGAWFGLAFGLGTFVSAFALTAGISGIIYRAAFRAAVSRKRQDILRAVCGVLLIIAGIWYIAG